MEHELLLVDDDPSALRVLEATLGSAGFACSVCSGAHAALERVLANERITVVLCDLYMPEMDGLQFTRSLGEIGLPRPAPRVLLLTARPSLYAAIEALRGGACDFLIKPVDATQLIDAVGKALTLA